MAIRTAATINTSNVTGDQLGACHKIISSTGNFYKVANSEGRIDDNGDIIEYSVRFLGKEKGFSCTCKAGQNAKLCWHIKASIACEAEVRNAIAELEAAIAVQKAMSDAATIASAEKAAQAPVKVARKRRETAPYAPRAFSILR
jgi:hypothetical protein